MQMSKFVFSMILAGLLGLPHVARAVDCFGCHDAAQFRGRVTHSPVAKQQCDQCHSPHVSRHPGLLLDDQQTLCYSCHPQVAEEVGGSKVPHRPVKEGQCSACHAPHASANPALLKQTGAKLCYGCHEEARQNFRVAHKPFAQGDCNACHSAHAGEDYRLLKQSGSALCLDCHQATRALQSQHLGRDLRQMDCLGCHNPHGGEGAALLRAVSHPPFAQQNCQACHAGQSGSALCLDCHTQILDSFNRVHSHMGVGGGENACTLCHNPHVGDRAGLLPNNEGQVCRSCHDDTFAKWESMLHKHGGWNRCSDCHYGHGGDSPAMLKNGENVCAQCHDLHDDFTHPQGEGVYDPRNGREIDCLTCHDANAGTMYKYFLHGSGERGLCVQCHQSY